AWALRNACSWVIRGVPPGVGTIGRHYPMFYRQAAPDTTTSGRKPLRLTKVARAVSELHPNKSLPTQLTLTRLYFHPSPSGAHLRERASGTREARPTDGPAGSPADCHPAGPRARPVHFWLQGV